jgi:hypothetical protein
MCRSVYFYLYFIDTSTNCNPSSIDCVHCKHETDADAWLLTSDGNSLLCSGSTFTDTTVILVMGILCWLLTSLCNPQDSPLPSRYTSMHPPMKSMVASKC